MQYRYCQNICKDTKKKGHREEDGGKDLVQGTNLLSETVRNSVTLQLI